MEDILFENIIEEGDSVELIEDTYIEEDTVSSNFVKQNKEIFLSENKLLRGSSNANQSDILISNSNDIVYVNNNEDINIESLDYFNKTVLWTNPSPDTIISAQRISLTDDLNNYDYIAIEFKGNTSLEDSYIQIMSTEQFLQSGVASSVRPAMSYQNQNSNVFYRNYVKSIDSSTVYLANNTNYQGIVDNTYCIPLNIYGLTKKSLGTQNITNNYNNYFVSGNETSTSYNIMNKPINQYTVEESFLLFDSLIILFVGMYLIIRRAVFKWR